MSTCCPYCESTQVHRIFISHPQQAMPLFSNMASISKIGLSAIIIKRLSSGMPLSPWMLRLAEVLLNSLMTYLLEMQRRDLEAGISIEFYCEHCHRSFKA